MTVATGPKTCPICGEPVPPRIGRGRQRVYCSATCRQANRWIRDYGLTAEQFAALEAAQGGRCHLCGGPPSERKRLEVDHDHRCCPGEGSCGRCVRGLLCAGCNLGLAHIERLFDAGVGHAAILAYLDRRAPEEVPQNAPLRSPA